ncbi:MAG TPA: SDR family NAD(P)-dependent oxidoreductase, partial [Longimicrobiales bacterium]|nr:SDR family NAD(P)-dependent oxidoreductase [Longimicrobiales bacterium]
PFVGPYAASKFALEAATDTLRVELMPFGITFSIVEPGVISTPIWDTSARAGEANLARMPAEATEYYGEALDAMRRRAARGITGLPPEKVADVVAHALMSRKPRIRYVVGRDARMRILMDRLLPVRWRDRMIMAVVRRL